MTVGFVIFFMLASGWTGNTPIKPLAEPSAAHWEQIQSGTTPKVFAPGLVSTEDVSEFSCCFSRDMKEFYFARKVGEKKYSIFMTRKTSKGWSPTEPASFSKDYFNHEPMFPMMVRVVLGIRQTVTRWRGEICQLGGPT